MCYVKSKWKKALSAIPVVGTFILEAGTYYCYIAGVYQLVSFSPGVIILHILVSLSVLLALFYQFCCILISPGNSLHRFDLERVPTESRISLQLDMNEDDFNIAKLNFCEKCNKIRPARTHHCSLCETCVFRYDHHCPWMGNCIGLYNYRCFLGYLTTVSTAAGLIGISSIVCIANHYDYNDQTISAAVIGLAVMFGLGGFTVFHFVLLSVNRTTIEMRIGQRNVFSAGCWANWLQICGPQWCLWVCPILGRPLADGVVYPVEIRLKDGSSKIVDKKVLV